MEIHTFPAVKSPTGMAVFLVSSKPCCQMQVATKAFTSSSQGTTMKQLVLKYHQESTENVNVVCGSGPVLCLEAATISNADLDQCTVGVLSISASPPPRS